jgi:hypothetical protein
MQRPSLSSFDMADGHYTPFSGGHTDRKHVVDHLTSSSHHRKFEGGVLEHLLAEMNHHMSRNGTGVLMYVSWYVGKDVHGACSVSSRHDIDTLPAARLYLALTVAKGIRSLTP